MPKLTVDGIEVEVPPGATVLQACEVAGAEVPRFCYHERLSIAGNCRMCLVEMEKAPKPIASCAMPAAEGMVVKTTTPTVRKARQGVMEFLLINHPLDCPICDQGGECDLQDQAMAYGFDRGRYHENKRAVRDKNLGPLIKTFMNRCIHCTRCIRFATEVAGVEELGATGRGEHMEVGTYIEKALTSEMSGNLVDLCPVGALTSKPYAFAARPWELTKTETIDVMDAVGSNIRVDVRGARVLRVLPRLNEDVNEEWISDKARHACDGLARQRLDRPYLRRDGRLVEASWAQAFQAIAAKVSAIAPERVAFVAGDQVDAEALMAARDLADAIGTPHRDGRQDGACLGAGPRGTWLFNPTIAGIDRADAILLVGADPRWEAPIVNARIRKRYLTGRVRIASVGALRDPTFRAETLSDGPGGLAALADGSHPFTAALDAANAPMIIVGMAALTRADGPAILDLVSRVTERARVVREGWNGFGVLHTAAARVAALDLGFMPGSHGLDTRGIVSAAERGDLDLLFLLGADEIDTGRLGKATVVYLGHHGDAGAARADIVLPGAAYTEKSGTWVNLEGRPQRGQRALFPPGDAREDWRVLRALSEALGRRLPYDDLPALRRRMEAVQSSFAALDHVTPADWAPVGVAGTVDAAPFAPTVTNFYMTCPISRASETMARCTALFVNGNAIEDLQEATGTYG
jgi:NADH-quinone oxidoreductase subunit G